MTGKTDSWLCSECGAHPPAFAPTFAGDPEEWVCPNCRESREK